ncbi:molybdopterin-dependent oxidoreductase [Nocardia sp. alder85J]|uniref:molybdopterin-dependent oxidoreductase n=1 Tax=Nocardia sp. alder85J TaxID=2862949 RepID=UPI001CD52FA4|nr:molybdopterin-dependent oxidoreductase [Nocardia sp. alder85J]MCX4095991.1 molybdopterin-dependent oxidoreductase [Nocardia sp. alder85J]
MAESGLRAACGVVSAGLALGVAELVALPIGTSSTPLAALGSSVVDLTPDDVREQVIQLVGTDDKLLLFVVMGVVAFVLAMVAGRVERMRRPLGSALLAAFGVLAALAAVTRSAASWTWMLPTVIGVAAGILALRMLIRRLELGVPVVGDDSRPPGVRALPVVFGFAAGTAAVRRRLRGTPPSASDPVAAGADSVGTPPVRAGAATATLPEPGVDRRTMLRGIAGIGVLAVVTGVAGRVLGIRAHNVSGERAAVRLPAPNSAPPPVDPAADLRLPGLTPYLTANSDFYRIDTALVVPQVSTSTWSLRIHGLVDREVRYSWADLANRPVMERLVTLTCVSNPTGGDLIGNARWLGYPLADLIAEAGPHPDADMVLSRSIDGFTAGSPLATLLDGRDAMLAIGMNGEPLPVEHGYPARLVVPGLYGYVSATKWVTELEITRFDRAEAFWTQRGWAPRGPIKTGTRIDTPSDDGKVKHGRTVVAGVAWAQHRGIDGVEVQIDNGPWQAARLAAEPSIDTWRQWAFDWDAPTGKHTIRARATDGAGAVQSGSYKDVLPDGAEGYPSIIVDVA